MAGLKSEEINVWSSLIGHKVCGKTGTFLSFICYLTAFVQYQWPSMIYQQEKLKLTARNPYYEAVQAYPHGLEQHPHFHTSSSFFVLSV